MAPSIVWTLTLRRAPEVSGTCLGDPPRPSIGNIVRTLYWEAYSQYSILYPCRQPRTFSAQLLALAYVLGLYHNE